MGFPRHRARGEPAVFAYGKPDPNPVQLDDRAAVAGLEVALLVEDAVVRQEDLVIDGRDLAVVQERGGVEEITVLVDKADHGGDVRGGPCDHAELREVVADECRLEDEVLGRIAGDRQLRKADDVGARGARLVHPADDQPRISGQVTDGWVDLGESNPHNSILTAPSPPLGLVVPVAYFDRLRTLSRERHTLLCVGLDPDPDRIAGVVAMAPPTHFHAQNELRRLLRFSFLATGRHRWLVRAISPIAGLFHPAFGQFALNTRNVDRLLYRQLMCNVVEDISPGVLAQFLKWARTDVFVSDDGKVDYRGGLASAKQPALFIAGERDLLAPPASVRPGFELWGGEKEFIELKTYGHSDLIFGRNAPDEIFPIVRDWLLKRSSPLTTVAPT